MDQIALLSVNLSGGWRLIGHLIARGFPVDAALWACREEEDRWCFYLESPVVNESGGFEAYDRVFATLRESPEWGLDTFTVSVVAAGDAMAKAARALAAADRVVPFRGGSLGGTYLLGAIIYPPWRPDFNPVM